MSDPALVDDQDIQKLDIVDETHLTAFTDGDAELEDELAELQAKLERMKKAAKPATKSKKKPAAKKKTTAKINQLG